MENLGSWWVFPPVLYMFWVLASCLSWQRFFSLSVACLCTLLTASVVGFLISCNPSCQLGSFPVLLESFRKSSPILMSWRILSLSHEQFQCFGFYIKVSDPFWIDFCARWDVVLISFFVYSVFPAPFADGLYAFPWVFLTFSKPAWPLQCGFMSGSTAVCLHVGFGQHCSVFVIMALWRHLKSGACIHLFA